jgi:hypothetical protein
MKPTVSRPFCFGARHPSGTRDQLWILDVGRSLWREIVRVQFSVFAGHRQRRLSGLSPTELISIFCCLYFWDSSNLQGQVPVFISPKEKVSPAISLGIGLI